MELINALKTSTEKVSAHELLMMYSLVNIVFKTKMVWNGIAFSFWRFGFEIVLASM